MDKMDKQTMDWVLKAISDAPNEKSLEGIRVTVEFFYKIDKDFEAFDLFINAIQNKTTFHEEYRN